MSQSNRLSLRVSSSSWSRFMSLPLRPAGLATVFAAPVFTITPTRAVTPGTNGKVTGNVIILKERTKEALEKYKGKLRGAVILQSPPANVAPVTDLRYLGGGNPPGKKDEAKKDEPKKDEIKKEG